MQILFPVSYGVASEILSGLNKWMEIYLNGTGDLALEVWA